MFRTQVILVQVFHPQDEWTSAMGLGLQRKINFMIKMMLMSMKRKKGCFLKVMMKITRTWRCAVKFNSA